MKCPNCEGVLPGSAIVCKACGHRLTQSSVAKWRAEQASSSLDAPALSESPLAAKMRARFTSHKTGSRSGDKPESNLIQFPVPANVTTATAKPASSEPSWRDRIKSSVQDHRTRQEATDLAVHEEIATPANDAGPADQLLLIESALKRIRRTQAPQPATVDFRARRTAPKPLHYPAAQSHALALMPEAERYAETQREFEPEKVQAEAPPAVQSKTESQAQFKSEAKPEIKAKRTALDLPSPKVAAESLKAIRTHKLTGAHLTLPLEEQKAESSDSPDFAIEALALEADTLPTMQENRHLVEAKPVELLRAKASYFAEARAAEATEEEPEVTPWHTDAEVEAVTQESDGQVWLGKPAPIWLRTLAGICDVEAAAILYLPFFSAYYALEGSFGFSDYYLMCGMAVVVMFLYQLVTFTLNGRTIGMALFGLRNFDVERVSDHISFKRRLQQALGGTLGLLCPPFNFVVTRVTGFQRGFGDALARTVTLRRVQE